MSDDRDSVDTARAALARADELGASVRHRARWLVRFHLVFSAGAAIMVLMVGLLPGRAGALVGVVLWGVVIAALSVYAARQPVAGRGMGRVHGIMIASWGVVYGVVLAVGLEQFERDPVWWVPGAVAVALPGLVSASVVTHRWGGTR